VGEELMLKRMMTVDRAFEIVDDLRHAIVEFDKDAALIKVTGTFTVEELEALYLTSKITTECRVY
jgi:hypothetical protein